MAVIMHESETNQSSSKNGRKKISKKRKSAWRKHSSVKEVDEYLERKRFDERTGGPINEKKDEELFFIETKSPPDNRTPKAKASRDKDFQLKCHSGLLLDSNIKPIMGSRVTPKKSTVKMAEPLILDLEDPLERKKKNDDDNDCGVGGKRFYDIWNEEKKDAYPKDDIFIHSKRVCRKIPVKPPKNFGKKSNPSVPAIPLPAAGLSYNPSVHDHQKLLSDVLESELKKQKAEQKIINATDKMFPTVDNLPTQETWLAEMSSGLDILLKNKKQKEADNNSNNNNDNNDNDDDDENKGDDNDGDDHDDDIEDDDDRDAIKLDISKKAPVRREDKKTERERKRMKMLKEEENKMAVIKKQKLKKSEEFRLKSLKKQVVREEMVRAARITRKQWEREKRLKSRSRKLGKSRFVEPQPPIKLTEELEGSLRLLKPESHIMKDLVDSLRRRNITPNNMRGIAKKPKRYRPKVYEKSTYKGD